MRIEGLVLGDRYKVGSFQSSSSFSSVYKAEDVTSGSQVIAKFYFTSQNTHMFFENELQALQGCQGVAGVPLLLKHGSIDVGDYLIATYGGVDLTQALFQRNLVIEAEGLKVIAERLVATLEGVHNCGFLHLDIRPDNILVNEAGTEVMLINYCFARKFGSKSELETRENAWFCSSALLRGLAPSRWSDLESLAYTLIMVEKGSLPWVKCKGFDNTNIETCLNLREHFLKSNFMATVSEASRKLLIKSLTLTSCDMPNYNKLGNYFFSTLSIVQFYSRGHCGKGKFYPLTMMMRGKSERRAVPNLTDDLDEPQALERKLTYKTAIRRKGSIATFDIPEASTPVKRNYPRLTMEVRSRIHALKDF
jgi:serine/threonine protein kinase